MKYIKRSVEKEMLRYLKNFPSVAIVGPRQCGKSTLAKQLTKNFDKSLYLDLENPDDLAKLENPTLFFQQYNDQLVCLDEIQRKPDLFPTLRSVIDQRNHNGQFIFLGSASPDLLKQSNETLAGRIIYQHLTPFLIKEIKPEQSGNLLNKYWFRGGFPRSYLATDDQMSFKWLQSFISTFLERDIPNLGINYPPATMRRLWSMLAHLQSQVINLSQIGNSMGLSHTMVRKYLDVLEQTFMIRLLQPFSGNLKKRLIKSPKVYIRDTGILHVLLQIDKFDTLFGHPISGPSWETLVIENIINNTEDYIPSFYRTSNGNEIDLVLEKNDKVFAIECKFSTAPKLTAGFFNAIEDVNANHAWVVAPVDGSYPIHEKVTVASIGKTMEMLEEYF